MRHKFTKEDRAKKEKSIVLFENEFYSVKSIPLNYRIDIKHMLTMKNKSMQLERDYYDTDDNRTVESSKSLAELIIKEYWRLVTEEEKRAWAELGERIGRCL